MRTAVAFFVAFCVSASAGAPPAQHLQRARPQASRTQARPIDTLFAQLKLAQTPEDAKQIEDQIGLFFMQSGSPSVDLLMTRGAAALAGGDKDTARKLFDAVTDVAPNFAEGWHSRAALQLAVSDSAGAMVSLQRAIALNPREFKAMSELGDMLEDYGDKTGALKLFRRALELDPKLDGAAEHVKALETDVEGQRI
jgi:tetratricopeptide (TPR) repeat protein